MWGEVKEKSMERIIVQEEQKDIVYTLGEKRFNKVIRLY